MRTRRDRSGDEAAAAGGRRRSPEETEETTAPHDRITVQGALDDSWSAWFDGLAIAHDADGDTTLAGAVRGQAALHGLLAKVRDLGLTLLAVEQRASADGVDPLAPPGLPDAP